jgi:Phosphoenolpyruvate synthase/pyruvate phosphate dikinase
MARPIRGLEADVRSALGAIEMEVGRKFGDAANPLLVSVRSGARVSMPGMMDTVLNLGLNDKTAAGLAKSTGNPRFAYDSYRRFIQMYGNVVLGVDHHHFEELLQLHKEDRGLDLDTELTAEDWKKLVEAFKAKVKEELGTPFPQDPLKQLWGAIGASSAAGARRAPSPIASSTHPRGMGHGGQCPGHGLRQYGRRLRHGRGLHPQSLHRRQ